MRKEMLRLALLAGFGLGFGQMATANAANGVHISFVDDAGQPASQLYVSGHKVRVESGNTQEGGILYDAATHRMTILMPEKHAYLVLDKQSAAELGARVQDAQKQMQEQMANMPPQQRIMMEQVLAQNGVTGSQIRTEVKDLGSSETVAGHRCHDMQIMRGGKPGLSMCVTPLGALGIPADAVTTLNTMRDDMRHLLAGLGPMAETYSTLQNVDGFAIKREVPRREGFKLTTVTEMLKAIKLGNPPASLFAIPAGYTQTSVDKMMQDGG